MTTTTAQATTCPVCKREDVPTWPSSGEGKPRVLKGHPESDTTDLECLGSRLPVLPVDASQDSDADKIRRYASDQYLKSAKGAREDRVAVAEALLSGKWAIAGALDYFDFKAIELEQTAKLWLNTAHYGDWVRGLSDALEAIAIRETGSSRPMAAVIAAGQREGARAWLRAARHQLTKALPDGITRDQMADLLFNL